MKHHFANAVEIFRKDVYDQYLHTLAQKVGVEEQLSNTYWKIFFNIVSPLSISVCGGEAKFRVTQHNEYRRVKDLMGEEEIVQDLFSQIQSSDVFYDIGANIGIYACLAANRIGSGQVIAFEPHPVTATRLKENLLLNTDDSKIYQYALSDTQGKAELALDDQELGGGEHALASCNDENTIQIKTITGDGLIQDEDLSLPDIVKIDVEGAELSVIEGMQQSLSNHCRIIYCEVHPDKINEFNKTTEELYDKLDNMGFNIEKIGDRNKEYFIKATNINSFTN